MKIKHENKKNLTHLLNQLKSNLIQMKLNGFNKIYCSKYVLETLKKWNYKISKKEKYDTMSRIFSDVKKCSKCKLYKYKKNIVFGEGNKNAQLAFIGEGPGVDEDMTGRPFVGAAGQLLNRIINAMKLKRETVYICNIVKCRPPKNRDPIDAEINACLPYLKRQINIVNPKIICLLGAVATKTILKMNIPISKLRGNFISLPDYNDIKAMPTYHPAYLLRNPIKKREVWSDIQKIMNAMK